jgi:hypothetical protein
MGLHPDSVVSYYNGSEEEYRPPRTAGSMLEVSHGHLAMMALVILLLTHLAIFIPFGNRTKKVLIFGTFAAAWLNESSGWLVRFVSPELAPLKVLGFVTLQLLLATLLVSLTWFLWRSSRTSAVVVQPRFKRT